MTQTVLLGDICHINPTTLLKKGSISKFVSMDKLDPFKRKIGGYEEREYKGGSKFINGDTLLARITPCLENGKTAYVDILADGEVGAGSTEFIVLRAIEGVTDPDYLYYLSITPDLRNYAIQAMIGTSGRQRVQNDVLARYTFELPDLPTQQRVGGQLRTIDEKIELNRQMNETLEQMGQALFRHYFIDNPEAETENRSKVSDFAEHLKVSVQPMKSPDTTFHQYSIPGYDNSYSPEVSRGETIKSGKYEVAPNSILVSKLNPATPRVWAVIEPKDNAVCSTEFQVIKPKDYYAFCYFLLTSREFTEKMTMSAGGTSNSHRRVKPSDILDFAFVRPREEALVKFEAKVHPMIEQIDANRDEIQTLTTLRDTLLPRLISGKVRV